MITNLHPKNKYSGCCPFVARSFSKLGLEEFSTAERKFWFPCARYPNSGNLVAVSFKYTTGCTIELFPAPAVEFWKSLAKTLDDRTGSEKTGVTVEEVTNKMGTKSFMNMMTNRPAEVSVE